MRKILLAGLILAALPASAAQYHWKFHLDSPFKDESVGDSEQKFVAGDWTCTVGKPQLDKSGTESRRFGCAVGQGGLQAFNQVLCYVSKKTGKPLSENGVFNLQQKYTGALMVALDCS